MSAGSGTSGSGERASTAPNVAKSTAAHASRAIVPGSAQPSAWPRGRANSSAVVPKVAVAAPGTSSRAARDADRPGPVSDGAGGSRRTASATAAVPGGTLTANTRCQPARSVSSPPRTRPAAAPEAPRAAQTPRTRLRPGPSGERFSSRANAAAEANAAPVPCTDRPASSTGIVPATAQSSEAAVNVAVPAANTRRPPARSVTRPANSSRPPNAAAYRESTYCRVRSSVVRSTRMASTATVVIVLSSTTMNWTTHSAATAARRLTGTPVTPSVRRRAGRSPR